MSVASGLSWRVILPLYVLVTTAIGFVDLRVRPHLDRAYTEYSPAVVANTEPPPGKYRVLAPFLLDGLTRVTGLSPRDAWVLFRWLGILAALLVTHWYLTTWFPHELAVTGNLLLAALLPLTFTNSWGHPDHFVELILFTLGCATIARQQWAATACVIAVALTNRETAAFLGLLFFSAFEIDRRHLIRTTVLAGLTLAVLAGLRWWRGWQFYDPWQLGRNLEFLQLLPDNYDPYYRAFAWFFVILIVPGVALVLSTWHRQPRLTRAGAVVVVPVLVVVSMLFTSVIETRVFTPVFPLLLPGVLFGIFPERFLRAPAA